MPTVEKPQSQKVCFARAFAAGGVAKTGFDDVSLITGDTEALGHGLFVDEKSVEECMALLLGKTLPAYVTHEGAMFSDRLGSEIGYFSGFYRDGLKLKAKSFRFFDSALKHDAASCERLMELAAKMPDQFGLSVVFGGSAVWVTKDGNEVSAAMPMPENALRSIPSVRFSYVESADFVKAPAANPDGLFAAAAAAVDALPDRQMDTPAPVAAAPAPEPVALAASVTEAAAPATVTFSYTTDKDAEIKALSETHTAELAKVANLHREQLAKVDADHAAALAAKSAEFDAKLAELQAKLAEAEQFDMRKAGAPALTARLGEMQDAATVPAPKAGATDQEKWEMHAKLARVSPEKAKEFFSRYIRPAKDAKRRG